MNSNINKEILSEIKRISQLMSINEQADEIIKGITRAEVSKIIRNEIVNALKQAVKREGYEAVEKSIKSGATDLTTAAQLYQNIYKNLGRAITNEEKFLIRAEATKMFKNETLNILKQEKNVFTKLAAKATTGVKNIVKKIKKLVSGGQKELKPTVAKTAQIEGQMAKIGAKEEQELVEGVTKKGWSWGKTKNWGLKLGLPAIALWWWFHDSDSVAAPDDIPEDNSNLGGTNTGSGGKYTSCSEELPIKQFCKNETIRKVQACLAMPAKYQTGNFGPITQKYLETKGQNGTTITTETIIAVCGTNNGITGSGVTSGTTADANAGVKKVVSGPTGYEDYTTDEIETSVEEPVSGNVAGVTPPKSAPSVSSELPGLQSSKKSFTNPMMDSDAVEQ